MTRWRRALVTPVVYDFGVEHERLATLGARLLWGADARRFYREIDDLRGLAGTATVLDVPCGGGVAFRGQEGRGPLRYLALDLSPVMLRRARANARRRRLDGVRFTQGSVAALPCRDAAFDLCLSYFGLHCFPDPPGALAEMARVLRPGGTLRGTAIVLGSGRRQDAAIRVLRRTGTFGHVDTAAALTSWLTAAGLHRITVERDGAIAFFSAHRPH
ncbi:class I SAM-dependent methyltransferase [Sphaerisporangium fuscum]|uniref:class I SAM-dependent methyltransferase n=1 Tax=Sphaerisporangium fuscum TaxID=2835868 RepID=UPI001BDC0EA5|nr:methyltransferase domain-containing protein [Sphaerisporangium fuscum]